jgi:hypothetical protein
MFLSRSGQDARDTSVTGILPVHSGVKTGGNIMPQENRAHNSGRWRVRLKILLVWVGIPWLVVIFGLMSFGLPIELFQSVLLKSLIWVMLVYSLLFIIPVIFIERYIPSKLFMVLWMYLFLRSGRKSRARRARETSGA